MAFIAYITYEDASEQLKALYKKFGGANQTPANIIRIAGHNPQAMDHHTRFYMAVQHAKTSLSRHQREMIALLVSGINQCHY